MSEYADVPTPDAYDGAGGEVAPDNLLKGVPLEGVPGNLQGTIEGGQTGNAWVAVAPTQVRRPWRATTRTAFQALVALAVLFPILVDTAGLDVKGIPGLAAVVAVMAAIARVMALPQVEVFLRRFVPFLAATPPTSYPEQYQTPLDAPSASTEQEDR